MSAVRRQWLLVTFLLLVPAAIATVGLSWNANRARNSDPISSKNYERIRLGMTDGEVQAVLGGPADRQYHPWDVAVFLPPAPGTSPEWEKMWLGKDKSVIIVHFDSDGKVCNKTFATGLFE
jgi:hypothetical protein